MGFSGGLVVWEGIATGVGVGWSVGNHAGTEVCVFVVVSWRVGDKMGTSIDSGV